MKIHLCHSREEAEQRLRSLEGTRTRTIHTRTDETVGDALHRRLGSAATRGAVMGGGLIGLSTAALTAIATGDPGVGAGIGLGVALTGGPFIGSLAAFSHALHFADAVGSELGPDLHRRNTHLVVAWPS